MKRISVLGLGAMGARMAHRLLAADFEVTVYNRSRPPAQPLADAGATVAATPADAVESADAVLSMVTDDDAARAVWLHPETGAAHAIPADAVALESSTVTPAWIETLGAALDARGATLLDAPVAGSRPQAEAGQLVFLVGGPAAGLDRVRPLLEAMGSVLHHAGGRGAGAWTKLAVNGLFGVQVAALAELLGMLQRAGIPPERAMAILGSMPIASPAAKAIGGLIVADRHAPLFPIDLVDKDFGYAVAAAATVGGRLPVVAGTRAVFREAQAEGHGSDNISGVARLFVAR